MSYLIGPERHLPGRVMDNDAIAAWMMEKAGAKLRGSWIETRTGIKSRHWVSPEEACSTLARDVCLKLFGRHPERRAEIRQIILSTVSGDYPTPPSSPLLQHALGFTDVGCFDLGAACAGFTTALHVASGLCSAGQGDQLVVSSEIRSKFLDE